VDRALGNGTGFGFVMLYRLLRVIFRGAMWIFFSRIEIEGLDHVPESGPLLLVPNHINGLVDGLIVAGCLERPVTLTAKSTLANIPFLDTLMRAVNVITFQRREDVSQGADPSANVSALEEARARLAAGGAICLFPEGKSHSEPSIRPFRTGAARIALAYLEQHGDAGGLRIVPVGLHFERKQHFRSRAWVGFGEALPVEGWRRDHPGGDARDLTRRLEREVAALSLNFDARARSELFSRAADVLATGGEAPPQLGLRPQPRLSEQVRLIHALQRGHEQLRETERERLETLEKRIESYGAELSTLGVKPHEVYLKLDAGHAAFFLLRELELVVMGLPIAAWGLLNHLLPALLVRGLVRKMVREYGEFASSAIFVGVCVFVPFYVAQLSLAAWLLPIGWFFAYAVCLPYGGVYAVGWLERIRGALRRSRTYLRWRAAPLLQSRLAEEGREIIAEIERLDEQLEGR
jgi:glycerol-3-phosphate O-acyltransferase/dihydroxyacetone phosphate acyltransferase